MDYYYSFKQYLKRVHHEPVWRVPLSTGYPCPNRINGKKGCTFCNGSSFIAPYILEGDILEKQIQKGIAFFGKRFKAKLFYGYFQENSSTWGEIERLEAMYRLALEHTQVAGLIISTRPDCITGELCGLIHNLGSEYQKSIWIELGLQSVHDSTLTRIQRNHSYKDFYSAAATVKKHNLMLGVHMIIGLPGETLEMMEAGVEKLVAENEIDGIKFRLLDIIPGTPIEDEYRKNPDDFHHFSNVEYIGLICNILERLPPDCVILRSFDYNPSCNLFKNNEIQLGKDDLLREVRYELERRGTRQGVLFNG
jgi:radical SAM protein (TIGR01212 family)